MDLCSARTEAKRRPACCVRIINHRGREVRPYPQKAKRGDNQRLFDEGEAVPEKAFTMGIKSIMQSKHILLIANGEKKAQIIRDAFFGPVTPKVPASILQLHNNVTVIVDKEAGKLIKDVL